MDAVVWLFSAGTDGGSGKCDQGGGADGGRSCSREGVCVCVCDNERKRETTPAALRSVFAVVVVGGAVAVVVISVVGKSRDQWWLAI